MKITRASCSLLICLIAGALSVLAQTPQVLSVFPGQNRLAQDLQPQIAVTFSTFLDSAAFTPTTFAVMGERSGYKTGSIQYSQATLTATFLPSTPFSAGERVIVALSRGIRSPTGDSLDGFTWTFRVPSARRDDLRFADAVLYPGGGWSVQCADMNRDGYPDIVSSSGVIRLNDGNGHFSAMWMLPDADPFEKIAVEDLDRDGILDVVYSGGMKIALSDGMGGFAVQTRSISYLNQVTGDFNSDGYPDMAGIVRDQDGRRWGISFNDRSGSFGDTVVIGSVSQGWLQNIETFDVDNDGHLDVLCAGWEIAPWPDGYAILVWKGNGHGAFDSLRIYASPVFLFPDQLYSSDFSNDGLADIAVMGYVGGLSLNLGGTFGTDTTSTREFWQAEYPGAVTGGDFNGDGWIDLIVSGWGIFADTSGFRYYAIKYNCAGIFNGCNPMGTYDTLGYGYLSRSVHAVDLDNDGDLDIANSYNAMYVNINTSPPVSVREEPVVPRQLFVDQNYPNPFNSETTINYRVPSAQKIRVQVYNTFGKEVVQLHNAIVGPGEHMIRWDGRNENLYPVASGVYFVRFLSSNSTTVLKVLHLK